jgi:chromosome segregation ATPase
MPATEETYRKQTTLHIVFAVSSIAMAVVTIWMIMADHLRPWKTVQREFHQIETAKLEAAEQDKLKEQQERSQRQLKAIDDQIAEVEKVAEGHGRKIGGHEASIAQLTGRFDGLDTKRKFQKAELDSLRSFYDGMIDRDERGRAKEFLEKSIKPAERTFEETLHEYEAAGRALSRAKLDKG